MPVSPDAMDPMAASNEIFDVAIVGGSLAGAATAWLLLRDRPDLKIVLLERAATHGRKVGEATVEVSAFFLTRVLGLTDHLQHEHLNKQGLRFWFANDHSTSLADCSEIGGRYLARVPSFQIDRARLDEEILRRAEAAGTRVLRPVTVQKIDLQPHGRQTVHFRQGDHTGTLSARWVVDASGVATLLARQQGWHRPNTDHPTHSAWARWRGVKDWDGLELARRHPEWASAHHGLRGTATNHLMGPGWWAWMIPLRGGDTSVGVVFDPRQVDWPEGGSVAERLKNFLLAHPTGRELMSDAQPVEGDVHWRRQLAYRSETVAGPGFVLVSDAAGFLDPFYSPGMDWLSFTVMRAVDLIAGADRRQAEATASEIQRYNADIRRSYDRWFDAIYRDKYAYLGDFELMRIAFLLDLGCYYLGVASQPFKRGEAGLSEPPFTTPPSTPVYWLMSLYNRRLAALGRSRRQRGTFGRMNHGQRLLVPGFTFSPGSARPLLGCVLRWLHLEITEGWRSWGQPLPPVTEPHPMPSR
jgi:flavin-dependent dehydrogenase